MRKMMRRIMRNSYRGGGVNEEKEERRSKS